MDGSAADQIRGSDRCGAACKGGKLYKPVRGAEKDCKSGPRLAPEETPQDVGGGLKDCGTFPDRLRRCGQRGSDKDCGQNPGKTNIPENGNGLGKDFSLIPEPG